MDDQKTMKIKVKFFAIARDLAATGDADVDLPGNTSAGDALARVVEVFPKLNKIQARLALAVNQSYARRDHILADGDELALIPPVSGG